MPGSPASSSCAAPAASSTGFPCASASGPFATSFSPQPTGASAPTSNGFAGSWNVACCNVRHLPAVRQGLPVLDRCLLPVLLLLVAAGAEQAGALQRVGWGAVIDLL